MNLSLLRMHRHHLTTCGGHLRAHVCEWAGVPLYASYLQRWGCAGRSEAAWLCERRWWRGCWGPPLRGWAAWAARPAAVLPGTAAPPARSGPCWLGCRFPTGTPPGPCTPAGSCRRRTAGSCPTEWAPGRLTGGGWLCCSHLPAFSLSPYPSRILKEENKSHQISSWAHLAGICITSV